MSRVFILPLRVARITIGTLALAGCVVGPDYQPSALVLPSTWHANQEAKKSIKTERNAQWWQHFNDPILTRLIDKATADNYDLKMAAARVAQARAGVDQAKAAWLPSSDLQASVTREANQIAMPGGSATPFAPLLHTPFNVFQSGFDASWELDLFGSRQRTFEAATAQWQEAMATRDDIQVSLLAEVARTYVAIRRDQEQLKMSVDTVAVNQHMLSIARQRFQAGQVPHLDVIRIEAQLEQSQATIPNQRALLAQREYAMDLLLGETPGTTHEQLGNTGPIPTAKTDLVLNAPAHVIAQRADIRKAERTLAAATAQQGIATARFFPNLSLHGFFGVLGTSTSELSPNDNKSWRTNAGLSLPIFNLGSLSAQLDAANAQHQEALANYQKNILAALSDVERAIVSYAEQERIVQTSLHEVETIQHARNIAQERFQSGTTSQMEVLEMDRTLLAAKDRLTKARADCSLNLIAVYKSLGGGWESKTDLDVLDQA